MHKNDKTKKKHRNSKLNSIFRTKKHKILSTKYHGFRSQKHNKTRKLRKIPHKKMLNIKRNFMNNPLNYLPLEDLFLNKNMNNMEMNVNPHLNRQIKAQDKKHEDKLKYIKKHITIPFDKLVHKKEDLINKIYEEIMAREYDVLQCPMNNSTFNYNLYSIKDKNHDYPTLEFKDNCDHRFMFFDYNKVSKNYDYFNVYHSYVDQNYFIFSVDLHGNNHCHIFVKNLFENKIRDIEYNQKHKIEIRTHEAFNVVSSNSNGNFIVHEGSIYFVSI